MLRRFARRAADAERRRPRGALDRPDGALRGDALRRSGTSSGVFGAFPVPIAGKTGTAEKLVSLPGYLGMLALDQSWWCGYGPTENPEIAVCVVIENGGHGGDCGGAGGAARCSSSTSTHRARRPRIPRTRRDGRMAYEAVDTRARGLRSARRDGAVGVLARRPRGSTGSLLARWSPSSATGCGRSTGSRATTAATSVGRQALYAAVGGVVFVITTLIDPDLYRRFSRLIFGGTFGLMLLVLVVGRGDARLAPLDRPRLLPLPALRVREGAVHALPRRVPRRPRAAAERSERAARRDRGRGGCRSCSSSCSPTSARRSSTRPSLAAVLFVAGVRWLHLAVLGSRSR